MATISRSLYRTIMAGHGFNDVYWFLLTLCLPLISREFTLNYTQSGFLLTFVLIILSLGSLLTGFLGDRLGKAVILSGGTLLASMGLFLASRSFHFPTLLLLLGLSFLGASTFHPAIVSFLVDNFQKGLGRVLGYFEFYGSLGSLLLILLISPLLDVYLSWQEVFALMALPGFIFFILFYRKLNGFEFLLKREGAKVVEEKRDFSYSFLFFFLLTTTIRSLAFFSIFSFLPTFFIHVSKVDMGVAGYLFTLTKVGAMAGALLLGYLIERVSTLSLMEFLTFTSLPFIYLLTKASSYWALLPLLFIFGILHAGIYPLQLFYLSRFSSKKNSGRLYGLLMFSSTIINAFSPGILGYLADTFGLVQAFQLTIGVIFLAGILFTLLKKLEGKKGPSLALSGQI